MPRRNSRKKGKFARKRAERRLLQPYVEPSKGKPIPGNPKAISRDDARRKGLLRYHTGLPCSRNPDHGDEFFVYNARCVECTRERQDRDKATQVIRNLLNRCLWGNRDRDEVERLLGYTRHQLMMRMQTQFRDGMSWRNHGDWHIDHVKPISKFLDEGVMDPKVVNALTNLQPLWAKDNLAKGAKFAAIPK